MHDNSGWQVLVQSAVGCSFGKEYGVTEDAGSLIV